MFNKTDNFILTKSITKQLNDEMTPYINTYINKLDVKFYHKLTKRDVEEAYTGFYISPDVLVAFVSWIKPDYYKEFAMLIHQKTPLSTLHQTTPTTIEEVSSASLGSSKDKDIG